MVFCDIDDILYSEHPVRSLTFVFRIRILIRHEESSVSLDFHPCAIYFFCSYWIFIKFMLYWVGDSEHGLDGGERIIIKII